MSQRDLGFGFRRAAAALLLVVLAACSPGGSHDNGPSDNGVAAVEAAVPALERSRSASAGQLDTVLQSAAAIDARDAAGVKGDRSGMRQLVQAHPFTATQLATVVAALPSGAQSYVNAAEVLAGAATRADLPAAQRTALTAVVQAARGEAAAGKELARVEAYFWPRYARMAELQATWLTRARAGWYRDAKESADAYAVLTAQARPPLEGARSRLSTAATARARATAAYAAAVTAFRAVPASPSG
jgi:hypothetical protein